MVKDEQEAFDKLSARLDEVVAQLQSLQSFNDPSVEGFYDSVEYKVEKLAGIDLRGIHNIQDWFDNLGADGWDLKGFDWGCAIFTRRVRVVLGSEGDNEAES